MNNEEKENSNTIPQKKQNNCKASCVRFNEQEYKEILKLQLKTGLSIPLLLKDALFKKTPQTILMEPEKATALLAELKRIGNNINQIAKKVNAGVNFGWNKEFEQCQNMLNLVTSYVLGIINVSHKNHLA